MKRNMEEKILNAIQHIRLKFEKKSNISFLESDSFQYFMIALENDGNISKRGKGKSASYFVRKNFFDSSSNEKKKNSNNEISQQQVEPFSSPQRIEKVNKHGNIDLGNTPESTSILHYDDTPQPCNHQRKIENVHLNKSAHGLDKFLQEKVGLIRKFLDNKQRIIDNLINSLNGVTIKRSKKLRMKIN